jgi:exopolyphosphatase/guanosine-5'-triphosphate,3'-diphosphate pyrophosphatase
VLSAERRARARALGAAVRLGCDLSGRNPHLLEKSAIAVDGDRLTLTAARGWEDMLLGEQTTKRAQTLASALRLKLEVG